MSTIELSEGGQPLSLTVAAALQYHGVHSPAGVAHAFKVLERALALLGPDAPCERREIRVATAFEGPGARDAFEFFLRAVSEGRYAIERGLARPERGVTLERFTFQVHYRGRSVTLVAREGTVDDDLIALARTPQRTPEQDARLAAIKRAVCERVLASPADAVYDVVA